jgi:hypothetical protein
MLRTIMSLETGTRLPLQVLAAGLVAVVLAASSGSSAQEVQFGSSGQVGERFKHIPALPAPRNADGRVLLGTRPGEIGLWLPFSGALERLTHPENVAPEVAAAFPRRPKLSEVPFQPWARALHGYRAANQLEPHTRCKPSGGPRQFMTPYGVEFVEARELQRIFILDLGGPHTYRTIHMDARSHPKVLVPSYYGHSIGHWEGDTLVVDTRGFSEAFWFDRTGLPHTELLHMIERFTRTDSKTIAYEVTIDDPGAYTATWSSGFLLGWDPEVEVFEYICQDNNLASDLMLGSQESVNRTSTILP